MVQAFEAAIRRLEQAGAVVRRQAFPIMQQILDLLAKHGPLVTAEAYVLHRHRLHGPDAARMDHRVATVRGWAKTSALPAMSSLSTSESS